MRGMVLRNKASLALSVACLGFGSLAAAAEPTVIAGSDRMLPLLQKLAARYVELHPDTNIEVSGGGSGKGLDELSKGEVTIAAVARPATDEETRLIRFKRGTDLIGVPIAMDAVVFFVNRRNGLASLTLAQIADIYGSKIDTWEELGVPIEGPIQRHMLPQDSGSVKVVQTRAMHGKGYTMARIEHQATRDVVNAVSDDPLSLGLGGMGYTAGAEVVPVRVDTDSPAIYATPDAVRTRKYPLAHYIYLYFAGQPSGVGKDFLRFIISPEGQSIISTAGTGAVTLPMKTSKD